MRMSRKGWNNVIIFAVASMILIFRFVSLNEPGTSSSSQQELRLLPAGATILRLELPGGVIERLGTEWRSEPVVENPVAVIDAWLHASLDEWHDAIGGAAVSQPVRVYLANSASPIELSLFTLGERHWLTTWQGQLLAVDPGTYPLLFPRGLQPDA